MLTSNNSTRKTLHVNSYRLCLALLTAALSCLQAQEPSPPPRTSVQIINATSVPSIALSINGKLNYPDFHQGIYTADSPNITLKAKYKAENKKNGEQIESDDVRYEPDTNQSLVILGDFSTNVQPGKLLQPGAPSEKPKKPYSPNVLFRVFSHDIKPDEQPVRIRIINGMPGKELKFVADQQKLTVMPGFESVLTAQPPTFNYTAEVDGEQLSVPMRQEALIRNAMVIFFLKEGKPTFMRAFENTKQSIQKLHKMQEEN